MDKRKIAHMTSGMHIHKTEEYDKAFEQLSRAEKRAIKHKKKGLKTTVDAESNLKAVCKWLKEVKGITEIDMMDLINYIPEYEEWLKSTPK